MSERASLSPHHRELMLSLAYLGGLTYALALRLLPCYSERTLQRDLTDLRKLGDVEKHGIYKPGPSGRSVKQYDVWTLTDKGHSYIAAKANDQYPTKPTKLRTKRVMPHDLLGTKTVVAMVERARQEGLSGLFVQCETRLNPDERRPIPDAVVIVQFGGGFGRPDIVPWTKDPAIEDETRSRFVIEVDYQTETLSVIAGKARAYRAAFENPEWRSWWTAQFGPLPIIIWVVADKDDDPNVAIERLAAIYRVWSAEWPNGYWIGTTEHRMEREAWAVYAAGTWGWYRLTTLQTESNAITASRRPALPAVAAQPVARPGASGTSAPTAARATAPAAATKYGSQGPAVTNCLPPASSEVHAMRQAPSATTNAAGPARTTAPVVRPAPGSDAAVVVPPHASTAPRQPAPVLPSTRNAWEDRRVSAVEPAPSTWLPYWLVDVSPLSILADLLCICFELAQLVRYAYDEVRYEVCYAVIRLLEVLGVIWMVRTSIRLTQWFFWEEGYLVVGGFLFLLVCLGALGWLGHSAYRTYQDDPLFSFSRPAPIPTAAPAAPPAAAVPPLQAPEPHPDPPPPPVQPTSPETCGAAHVVSEGLNLRETPGGRVLTVLARGQEVVLLCAYRQWGGTEWVYVRKDEHMGWVSGRYLGPARPGR